jgi:hypothetical protein
MTSARQGFQCSVIWVQVVVPSKFLLAGPLGATRRGLRRILVSPFLGSIVYSLPVHGTLCSARRNSCNRKKGILWESPREGQAGDADSLAKLGQVQGQVINTDLQNNPW